MALIKISHSTFTIDDLDSLSLKWLQLSTKASKNVFISWPWIKNWLLMVKQPMYLIEAKRNDEVVGLGVFVEKTRKVFGLFPIKQWLLHRTGEQRTDQIWIEHNDFLLHQDYQREVRESFVDYLIHLNTKSEKVAEFIVGLSSNETQKAFKEKFKQYDLEIDSIGFSVVLSDISTDYISELLSKNARSQIKRSIKLLNQQGNLDFRIVSDIDEIDKLMPAISDLHIHRWSHTLEGSGFSNKEFVDFHRRFISSAANDESQRVDIAVLSLDNSYIGYLYNFVQDGHVYFYLSALTRSTNNKIKIGLVMHSMAIQYYLDHKAEVYDFLGGQAQYKHTLSNRNYPLSLFKYQLPVKLLQLELQLKKLKRFILNKFVN